MIVNLGHIMTIHICVAILAGSEINETLSLGLGLDHFPGLGLDLGLENTHFPGLGLGLSLKYS